MSNYDVKTVHSAVSLEDDKKHNDFADAVLKNIAVSVKRYPNIIFNVNPKTLHKTSGDRVEVSIKVKMPPRTPYHDFYSAYAILTSAVANRQLGQIFGFNTKNPACENVEGVDEFSLYENAYFSCSQLRNEGSMIDPLSIKVVVPGAVFWNAYEWVVSYTLLYEILDYIFTSEDLVRVG